MINTIIQKSAIALLILSLTGNVSAGDNKRYTTASSGSVAVASGAMIAGSVCATVGAAGICAQMNASDIGRGLPPSMSAQISSLTPYGLLVIPGIIIGVGAALYTFKSAKGAWAKIRATLGSSVLLASGVFLAIGYMGYTGTMASSSIGFKDALWYAAHNARPPTQDVIHEALALSGLTALSGAALSIIGYAVQPVDKSK